MSAVFDAVYVQDRELVAVQVRGPFRRLLGAIHTLRALRVHRTLRVVRRSRDVANHVRMVSGPGEVVESET